MAEFDVVIVGGGLVGSSLAIALQQCGLRTAMIEAGEPVERDLTKVDMDSRVIAIGHAGIRLMQFCGAWPLADPARIGTYTKMEVEAGNVGRLSFDTNDITSGQLVDGLGCIVENQVLLAGLQTAAESYGVACYYQTKVSDIHEMNAFIRVVSDDTQLTASLLVAADGASSWVREQTGIGKEQLAFDQMGLVTRIQVSLPQKETAWQRFMETGPLALLPVSDDAYSIVWSVPHEYAEKLMSMSAGDFEANLVKATQGKFGAVRLFDKVRGFPLVSTRVERYFSGRVVLCGDAAHQIHPLAGQGANLGFKDVIELTDRLLAAKKTGTDIANRKYLRAYERARKADNVVTDRLMHALHHMFAGRMNLATPIFARGMNLFNALPSVKHWLVEQATQNEPVSVQLQGLGYPNLSSGLHSN